jgi:hypothetical protein
MQGVLYRFSVVTEVQLSGVPPLSFSGILPVKTHHRDTENTEDAQRFSNQGHYLIFEVLSLPSASSSCRLTLTIAGPTLRILLQLQQLSRRKIDVASNAASL